MTAWSFSSFLARGSNTSGFRDWGPSHRAWAGSLWTSIWRPSHPVATAPMARVAVDELVKGGIELENITFFVAIGVHRPATEDEMRCALGELYGKVECVNHTPFDKDNLIYLGDSSNGTPVTVNRRAYECDVHVQIGKVEPHEFAGFSGGRKSVLPGISSEETIRINHRPELSLIHI